MFFNPKFTRFTALDFTADGTPYLAIQNNSAGPGQDGLIDIRKLNGDNWESINGNTFRTIYEWGDPTNTGFSIGTDNIPQVFYSDINNGGKACLKKFTSSTWTILGDNTGFADGYARIVSSDTDSFNHIYAACQDANYFINIKMFDGTNWQTITNPNVEAYSVRLKIANNIPYIAYSRQSDGKIVVKKFVANSWQTVGVEGFSVANINNFYLDIQFYNNIPYVLYNDSSLQDALTLQKFNGTNWEIVGINGFTPANVGYFSLVIDNAGTPHVAYSTGSTTNCYVKKFNGTNWVFEPALPSTDVSNTQMKLIVDSNNVLYLSRGRGYVYRLLNGVWESIGIDNEIMGYSGDLFDIAFDNANQLYILYKDVIYPNFTPLEKRLTVKKFDGSLWQAVGNAKFSAETYAESYNLEISQNNVPIVTFSNYGAFAKYFGDANALAVNQHILVENNIRVYPNPAINIISVSTNDEIQNIYIFDMTGKKVFSSENDNPNINIELLQNGLYIVKVKTANGIFPSKIIKE